MQRPYTPIKPVWDETKNELVEFGKSIPKEVAKAVVTSLNPFTPIIDKLTSPTSSSESKAEKQVMDAMAKEGNKETGKSTPINFKKLQENYSKQDDLKLAMMRDHLFKMVKDDERKAIDLRKREEEERKQLELLIAQETAKKEEEERQKTMQAGIPKGKEHKSILGGGSHKAQVGLEAQPDYKPSKSKG